MNVSTFYETVRHLRAVQVWYQVWYRIKNRYFRKNRYSSSFGRGKPFGWHEYIWNRNSYVNDRFTFLNVGHRFDERIDWNISSYGKLWTYNINYFDFLNQKDIGAQDGSRLIDDFISQYDSLLDGLEPYPTSLRIINWIKFIHRTKHSTGKIDEVIGEDVERLSHNLEFHLLANHLLENAFALFMASYYFENSRLYEKARKLLTSELEEQILKDGAHYELSVMYHQLMLYRVLDCLYLVRYNQWKNDGTDQYLESVAMKMMGWLSNMTFSNGDFPLFNDAARNITPSSGELVNYGKALGLKELETPLQDSGYRKVEVKGLECICDVGNLQATYQPAHTHADTFSYVLYADQKPLIVDTGTSTYEKNKIRHLERSTSSHNTVTIDNANSTDVWSGFRVGRRAKVNLLEDRMDCIYASHNGYRGRGVIHKRKWSISDGALQIYDLIGEGKKGISHIHFHHNVTLEQITEDVFQTEECRITFSGMSKIEKANYNLVDGWNVSISSTKLKVHFKNYLEMKIEILES